MSSFPTPISYTFDVLYQDEHLVAINKPYGFLTHRTALAKYETQIVLQALRDQLGRSVHPIHRLDRKTSGVLLWGLDSKAHSDMSKLFQENLIKKSYLAIVRGYTKDEGTIDYPLKNEAGRSQEAVTNYKTLERKEQKWPLGKHETSRYSLLELNPTTGRMHQLRRHLSHIFHPIIGDRPHGCSKQNRMFKQKFGFEEMLLHASSLSFTHPYTDIEIKIQAPLFESYLKMASKIGFMNVEESNSISKEK